MNGTWWSTRARSAPTGITLAAGSAAVVATALSAAALTAPSESTVRLTAMALCVAAVGASGGDLVAALATAAIAWSVLDGFLATVSRRRSVHTRRQAQVADVVFVLLTIALFAVLGLAVRAVERL